MDACVHLFFALNGLSMVMEIIDNLLVSKETSIILANLLIISQNKK